MIISPITEREDSRPLVGAETRQVIITNLQNRGSGVEGNPFRLVKQVWSLDGKIIAESDPCCRCNKTEE